MNKWYLMLALLSANALADGITFGGGNGYSRWTFAGDNYSERLTPDTFRIVYTSSPIKQWDGFSDHRIVLEWEAGLSYWKDSRPNRDNKIGVVFTPMFRYLIPFENVTWYAGLGVGASYHSGKHWMDRELGSRWLFEDKFEAGVELFDHHRLSYSLNHYSNANLADVNHGVNVQYVNYTYQW